MSSSLARVLLPRITHASLRSLQHGSLVMSSTKARMLSSTQKGDMMKYQQSLPSLPVPTLEQTLQRYLVSVRPLLTDQEFEQTRMCVSEFGSPGAIGEQLHKQLAERAQKKDNWLSEWWLNVAYLGYRLPVPIHVSPSTLAPRLPIPDHDTYLNQITTVLLANTHFKRVVDLEMLPPDMAGKTPLSMDQYHLLYSCNRIPRDGLDELRRTPPHLSLHVVVAHNSNFYKVQTLYPSRDGNLCIAPFEHVKKQIAGILNASTERAQYQVGLLTAEHRDTWAEKRKRLIKDPINQRTLDVLEQAILLVCLDAPNEQITAAPQGSYSDEHATILAQQCLHGNGPERSTGNRWFDTADQFIISSDGALGSTLEHSAADGTTAIRSSDFVVKCCFGLAKFDIPDLVDPSNLADFEPLKWNITPDIAEDIRGAEVFVQNQIDNFEVRVFTFNHFGKDGIKVFKVSPDAFVQQALQLAFYRCHGRIPAVYESAATRKFKLGRTETIRSQSPQSQAFCQAMCNPAASAKEKLSALREAVEYHSWYTREAINAQGVDRHLLGLKLLANQAGMPAPSIYTDVAYSRSLTHGLSTSQVPVEMDTIMCFGPTSEGGYGVCYNPRKDKILIVVSCFKSAPATSSTLLGDAIAQGLKEMRELMSAAANL